ncbi:MAG TPA: tripartite tricarboxylate transporter substrate binding protein [Rhodopila sp.]|uniref:tripartite tricarboxylate transporter substrate binding protein n=1 Tax=Rhodopila sp. TaxID=2480087 RepID=UPI002C195BDD|nr:tripartite tricarboxylate transporter substrate binding protein [Rhodopila sp.]HVY13925.1 tripartite tricarboxylate transporter substrate binding protein [Rhodopila sp.]
MIRRRSLLGGCALLSSVWAGLSGTAAQGGEPGEQAADQKGDEKGAGPVYLLVGVPAGSVNDRIARDFAQCFGRHLGAEVDPVSRPGNGGYTMLTGLADAPPPKEATTGAIGWVMTPTLAARAIDRGDPSLLDRIRLVGQVEREPIAFVTQADKPADSVQDIIRRASDDADAVPLATPLPGSPAHLTALRLQGLAQTRLNIVTFPSPAAARQALVAGNVSAAALNLSEVIGSIQDGTLSALGITAHRRLGLLPDTPVLDEAGIPLRAFVHRGIGVPAGTPQPVIDRLATTLQAVAADEAFQRQAEQSGCYVAWADGAAWTRRMQAEAAMLRDLWRTDPWLASSGG